MGVTECVREKGGTGLHACPGFVGCVILTALLNAKILNCYTLARFTIWTCAELEESDSDWPHSTQRGWKALATDVSTHIHTELIRAAQMGYCISNSSHKTEPLWSEGKFSPATLKLSNSLIKDVFISGAARLFQTCHFIWIIIIEISMKMLWKNSKEVLLMSSDSLPEICLPEALLYAN